MKESYWNQPSVAWSRRLLIFLLTLVFGFGVARGDAVAQNEDEPENAASAPVKLLPDLRAFVGVPESVVDLTSVGRRLLKDDLIGAKDDDANDGAPENVQWEIVSGGDDVADLSLHASTLVLKWKPDVVGETTIALRAHAADNPERTAFISFKAELWQPNYLSIFMAVLGGGGLFLFGMKLMSDGLQAAAGSRLRRLVSLFTNNRFLAIGVGVVVTSVIQSSTATSVMTLGLVNSGLMTLRQAIGTLLGANIGTTTTGWILAFNVAALGLPSIGLGAIFYLFSKKERTRNIASVALGLGMIFFGLATLKGGLEPLSDSPQFAALIQASRADSLRGAILCAAVGCFTTALVHSSSAVLAITITLTTLSNSLDLNTAAAIILGSNVGTSLTPLIVAINAPANTRRAAYFHTLFNSVGVVWALAIFFPIFMPTVESLGDFLHMNVSGKTALTHTLFNVVNTIFFIPLIGPISNFLEKKVSDKTEKPTASTTGLADFNESEPMIAIERSRLVVAGMFLDCEAMLNRLEIERRDGYQNEEAAREIFQLEEKLDVVQDETIHFITRLAAKVTSTDVATASREQIRIAEELESISDYLVGALKSNLKLQNNGRSTPKFLDDDFNELATNALNALKRLGEQFGSRVHTNVAKPMEECRAAYVARAKLARERFLQNALKERIEPDVVIAVDYQINAWRQVYEKLLNIAEALEIPAEYN